MVSSLDPGVRRNFRGPKKAELVRKHRESERKTARVLGAQSLSDPAQSSFLMNAVFAGMETRVICADGGPT